MNAMTRMMAAGLLALAMNGACRAESIYTFTIDDSVDMVTASGTITTGAADSGGYDVTSITGTLSDTVGSLTITGLNSSYEGADNIVYPTSSPLFDENGLSFDTSDGDKFNLYSYNGSIYLVDYKDSTSDVKTTLTLTPASVPEPASLAMVACGLGLAGLTAWRRRRRAETA